MELRDDFLEETTEEVFITEEDEQLIYNIERKIKVCKYTFWISLIVGFYCIYDLGKNGFNLIESAVLLSCFTLAIAADYDESRFYDYYMELLDELCEKYGDK